ncbi:hypothetical protein K8R42_03175 [bacterium]|nr:hypothetical protein [bacterium]
MPRQACTDIPIDIRRRVIRIHVERPSVRTVIRITAQFNNVPTGEHLDQFYYPFSHF